MKLELAILNVLETAPRAVNVPVIAGFVPNFTGVNETHADIERSLTHLQSKGQVNGTKHEDRGTVWAITAEGRLRLANAS